MSLDRGALDLADGVDGGAQLGEIVPMLGAVVARVRPVDLNMSTPCAAWTTRDLLNHVIGGAQMYAGALGGGEVHDISGRLPDVIGDDPMAAFGAAAEAFGAATQQPGAMDRVLSTAVGPLSAPTFLRYVAFDLLMHSWDLATALGVEIEVTDPVLAEIDAFAHLALLDAHRDGINFGPPLVAPTGSSPLEVLVAYSGRNPVGATR